jgi:predicted oxidoreductase
MPEHRDAPPAIELKGHAVVLGGGIAGMLAAGVLADYFELVMIIERHVRDSVGTRSYAGE